MNDNNEILNKNEDINLHLEKILTTMEEYYSFKEALIINGLHYYTFLGYFLEGKRMMEDIELCNPENPNVNFTMSILNRVSMNIHQICYGCVTNSPLSDFELLEDYRERENLTSYIYHDKYSKK